MKATRENVQRILMCLQSPDVEAIKFLDRTEVLDLLIRLLESIEPFLPSEYQ